MEIILKNADFSSDYFVNNIPLLRGYYVNAQNYNLEYGGQGTLDVVLLNNLAGIKAIYTSVKPLNIVCFSDTECLTGVSATQEGSVENYFEIPSGVNSIAINYTYNSEIDKCELSLIGNTSNYEIVEDNTVFGTGYDANTGEIYTGLTNVESIALNLSGYKEIIMLTPYTDGVTYNSYPPVMNQKVKFAHPTFACKKINTDIECAAYNFPVNTKRVKYIIVH